MSGRATGVVVPRVKRALPLELAAVVENVGVAPTKRLTVIFALLEDAEADFRHSGDAVHADFEIESLEEKILIGSKIC